MRALHAPSSGSVKLGSPFPQRRGGSEGCSHAIPPPPPARGTWKPRMAGIMEPPRQLMGAFAVVPFGLACRRFSPTRRPGGGSHLGLGWALGAPRCDLVGHFGRKRGAQRGVRGCVGRAGPEPRGVLRRSRAGDGKLRGATHIPVGGPARTLWLYAPPAPRPKLPGAGLLVGECHLPPPAPPPMGEAPNREPCLPVFPGSAERPFPHLRVSLRGLEHVQSALAGRLLWRAQPGQALPALGKRRPRRQAGAPPPRALLPACRLSHRGQPGSAPAPPQPFRGALRSCSPREERLWAGLWKAHRCRTRRKSSRRSRGRGSAVSMADQVGLGGGIAPGFTWPEEPRPEARGDGAARSLCSCLLGEGSLGLGQGENGAWLFPVLQGVPDASFLLNGTTQSYQIDLQQLWIPVPIIPSKKAHRHSCSQGIMKFKGHLESPGLGWLTCPTSWVYTLLGSA